MKFLPIKITKTSPIQSQPKATLGPPRNAVDHAALRSLLPSQIKNAKSRAVEINQPLGRPQPQTPVIALRDCGDSIRWKPVGPMPRPAIILKNRPARVQSQRRERPHPGQRNSQRNQQPPKKPFPSKTLHIQFCWTGQKHTRPQTNIGRKKPPLNPFPRSIHSIAPGIWKAKKTSISGCRPIASLR